MACINLVNECISDLLIVSTRVTVVSVTNEKFHDA